jgi:uncharacterized repeat protein (TIGR01451 family)
MRTLCFGFRHGSRAAVIALGVACLCAPAAARAQVTMSSAANQLFHVNDASTAMSPITVTDVGGGNIKQNRDIRLIIPTGFNMTWDPTVTTATITGTGAARCATNVAFSNGNLTVTINVTSSFQAGEFVVISGLKFTGFTGTSAANHLAVDLKNNPGVNATDPRAIRIDPYYDVAIAPATASLTSLPTNTGTSTVSFTLQNIGAVSETYDLLTAKKPGTALTVVSITGPIVTQGANPDSARSGAVPSTGATTTTVTVTYKVGNVAAGTIDTLKLTGRAVDNPARTSTGVLIVTVVRPVLAIGKAVSPTGSQLPGTDLTFTSTLTNTGSASASSVVIADSIPSWVQYKLATASATLPAGVTAAIEYSSDGGTTWTYTPASGACSAPVGFDRCVNRIRWRLLAALSSIAPNNQGTLQFVSRIR